VRNYAMTAISADAQPFAIKEIARFYAAYALYAHEIA
jgi:hypothetical protein